jgi:hypothetical protein
MIFEITDDEKKLILKRRQEQRPANIGMSSGSAKTKSRREPEFSAFADEMKRLENTGFLAD